jgi:hypothetical protein
MEIGGSLPDLLHYLVLLAEKLTQVGPVEAEAIDLYWFRLAETVLDLVHKVVHGYAEIGDKVFFPVVNFLLFRLDRGD